MEFAASIRAKLTPTTSDSSKKSLSSSSSTPSVSSRVTGTPETIAKYVNHDIQIIKQEIKCYNQVTNVFANQFYYKLYKLIETNQSQELTRLKQKFQYQFSSEYYKALVAFYKTSLHEYEDFLHLIQYNLNNGLLNGAPTSNGRRLSNIDVEELDKSTPEALVDPLSLEIFTDPVISPSGITYEKSLILAHLSNNGPFDPMTKQTLSAEQLYPNLAVKNSVNQFIDLKSLA